MINLVLGERAVCLSLGFFDLNIDLVILGVICFKSGCPCLVFQLWEEDFEVIDQRKTPNHLNKDSVFTYETVPFKFGAGVTEEIATDLSRFGVTRVLLVSDPRLHAAGLSRRVADVLKSSGIDIEIFSGVLSEPTVESWREAIDFAVTMKPNGFVALGGGSSIDTAKAANLYSTYPADLLDYVNAPIGKAKPVPGPLKPLVVIPTTAGSASECTTVAILEIEELKLKTGISHRYLRPTFAVLDPLNTTTCPPMVTASCGIDVLCHAIESFTALPFNSRPRPASPELRPPYVGSNPVSDLWAAKSMELVSRYLARAVRNGKDLEARSALMLACTYAGIGFGNAGVHVPHAMGYPIAGMVESYIPPDYGSSNPLVPHGIASIIAAPAWFRFIGPAVPNKHLEAACLMGCDTSEADSSQAGEILSDAVVHLMREVGIPNGLSDLGYTAQHIPALAEGTMRQERLLALSPCQVTQADVEQVFRIALRYW